MPGFIRYDLAEDEVKERVTWSHESCLPEAPEGQVWVETPESVEKWTVERDGSELKVVPFVRPPEIALYVARTEKLAALAALRWEKMQTFVYDGQVTWADAAVRNLTAKKKVLEERIQRGELSPTVVWKMWDGVFRLFDLQGLTDFGLAVDAHIQACFDREASHAQTILTQDPATVDIQKGWPS